VVTLICDDGQRYQHTYFDGEWLQAQGLSCQAEAAAVDIFLQNGAVPSDLLASWSLAGDLC